jgi:hypothetical protein
VNQRAQRYHEVRVGWRNLSVRRTSPRVKRQGQVLLSTQRSFPMQTEKRVAGTECWPYIQLQVIVYNEQKQSLAAQVAAPAGITFGEVVHLQLTIEPSMRCLGINGGKQNLRQ